MVKRAFKGTVVVECDVDGYAHVCTYPAHGRPILLLSPVRARARESARVFVRKTFVENAHKLCANFFKKYIYMFQMLNPCSPNTIAKILFIIYKNSNASSLPGKTRFGW